ncbi:MULTISPECIES: sugar-binding transcriptional regulator [Kocuria]|uniref:sugar-binding transcriptional regulator n=1 Tax=Kocuria TaxID=57493 RepID=UPI0025795FC3|nr:MULTISPECIES: sugar-binding domain-containing protein [Kocuria]MCT1722871.1 Cro/Cl family transcriptional regulator [Kocuria marina]MCT1734208.1 Cro/Cl family transcriptional regulator [Kocuria marina]MCT2360621.1 Cro/Cl family transcriptional regulator [Kocuria marina]
MPTTAPWPPTDPGQRQRLLAHLAHEYFVEGTSKIALGKKSGLSRFQVAALLQEAQDTGIVRIEIAVPLENSDEDLARTAGLQRLVTVGSTQWPADREALAKAVAREITRVLHDDDVLGISWSRTLQLVVHDLPALPHNDVIQLAGALSTDDRAAESPRLLASLRCRSVWPLWAPLVVEQADSLKKSREIELTLRRADSLDVAVLAVGGWTPDTSTVWPRIADDVARAAQRAGAVAEVSGHLLDAEGHELDTPVSGMIVAASVAQLRAAHRKVAVASGAERAPAVLAAVRGGLVDHLVCDAALRNALEGLLPRANPAKGE